jgi:hypothetical protein
MVEPSPDHPVGSVRTLLPALAALVPAAAACTTPEPVTAGGRSAPSPSSEESGHTERTLAVVGAGDILVHASIWSQARRDGGGEFDFAPMPAGLSPVLDGADLALCHLEVPLAPPEGPFTGYPVFSAPPQVAAGLAEAGYDGCSTASNHTLDMGADGVERTLSGLEAAGLGFAGSARTEEEAAAPRIYRVRPAEGGDVPVAHLSYTYGFNGFQPPEGREWMGNQIAGQSSPPLDSRREGLTVRVEFTEVEPGVWESGTLEAVPTRLSLESDIRLMDLAGSLADPGLSEADRHTYQNAYDRVIGHVDGLGVTRDPDFTTAS